MTREAGPAGPEIVRPGLSRILHAFERSGHPEGCFRTLHIAGTNGKGSTACIVEAVVRRLAAPPVGLYTSPHLVSPEERIRVDGKKIPASALRAGFRAAEETAGPFGPLTYFERMTWTAVDWFRRRKVRLAVMETGLGGRWDATTACRPAVTIITNVGYDHRDWLGDTIPRIASEKAGILKEGVPLVTGRLRPAARTVVRARARSLGCPTWELGKDFDWREAGDGTVTIALPGNRLEGLRLALIGRFQRDNASVALAGSWRWAVAEGIDAGTFARAARSAVRSARWPGRLCPIPYRRDAVGWVDGGHNRDAARALAREISDSPPWGTGRNVVALWSMLADKDATGYLREIVPHLSGVVTYRLLHDRAADVETLRRASRLAGAECVVADDFPGGWRTARRWAGKGGVVLVCGSLAAAGDAYRHLEGEVP
ncbi:MAG: bifunctional folylpolyglutamate synthase/dihydrofolate synthase [Deltaproteobacteria bacterium]|nr:MAG: bifunctional folylpolyglutamate synthase/dihydrofolate synthase [Deltaproteobacteria bacterium]